MKYIVVILFCFFVGCDTTNDISCIDHNGHEWKEGAAGWKLTWGVPSESKFTPTYFRECIKCDIYARTGVPYSVYDPEIDEVEICKPKGS